MKTMPSLGIKITAIVTLSLAAFMGCCTLSAARADDGMEGHGRWARAEKFDIRLDEERLHRLESRMREEMHCRDYSAARITRLEILDVRRDIERDRRELDRIRRDAERDRRYHSDRRDRYDRDGYRVRD